MNVLDLNLERELETYLGILETKILKKYPHLNDVYNDISYKKDGVPYGKLYIWEKIKESDSLIMLNMLGSNWERTIFSDYCCFYCDNLKADMLNYYRIINLKKLIA